MQPPICFVCNRDFAPPQGELILFVASEAGIRWEQRADESTPTMTGHHPDRGWFCQMHAPAARQLVATHTIDAALLELRERRR